jgi:hypothetical protein
MCGGETWTLRRSGQKYLERFEMWYWRKMEKINWIDTVRNEAVLRRVKEDSISLRKIKKRKTNGVGNIVRMNFLLKYVMEGKLEGRVEVTGGLRRSYKQLLDGLKKREDTGN